MAIYVGKPQMREREHLQKVWDYINSGEFIPSYSSLNQLWDSNLHFTRYLIEKLTEERKQTPAMKFGFAVDNALTNYYFNGINKKVPLPELKEPYLVFYGEKRSNEQKAAYAELEKRAKELDIPVVAESQKEAIEDAINGLMNIKMEDPRALNPYQIMIKFAHDTQVKLMLKVPVEYNFFGNAPYIRGVADVYGKNINTGRFYVADLKKVPDASAYDVLRTIRSRRFAMQLAIYGEALRQQGIDVREYYNVVYDEQGHVNIFSFAESDIHKGLKYAYEGCRKLDALINRGDKEDLLYSYTRFDNCALYIDKEVFY